MKKDKVFRKTGKLKNIGWEVVANNKNFGLIFDGKAVWFSRFYSYKNLRKFIKALKKGLRRLER